MKQPNKPQDRSPFLLEIDHLDKKSLTQIVSSNVLAIVVKDFYPKDPFLFNSNCLHMARPSNGISIAHSCFMGFRGFDVPLTVWS